MRYWVFLLMLVVLAGCNLREQVPAEPDIPLTVPAATDIAQVPTATPSPTATYTPLPTQTPVPTVIPTSAPPSCVVTGNGWPIYTVQRGDTLFRIAGRSNSTVAELSRVNCLSDPRNIQAGQTLYVPQLPAPPAESVQWIPYTWSTPGITFSYAPGWTVQDSGDRVVITTFDPANRPAMAAWTPQTMEMELNYVVTGHSTLREWATEMQTQFFIRTEVRDRGEVILPNGSPAIRLDVVSGAGHLIVHYYTRINGKQIAISHTGGDPVPAASLLGTLNALN